MAGFDHFIRERQYLHNVSPRTIEWYHNSLRWLPGESPTQEQLNDLVIRMRERGLKATGCNCAIRAINAYLKWSGSSFKIRPLKEPREVLPTFTDAQIKSLVKWKPKDRYERRLHLLVLFLIDTGCRVSEAVGVRVRDMDLDNLLVTLQGKGSKQRIIPFSLQLRRVTMRYRLGDAKSDTFLFVCDTGAAMERRNVLRAVKGLCKHLGFNPPARTVHALRHTFAVNYLRRGGSVFHLQKVLGHSTLEMTRRYANLVTSDLQAVHEQVSLLSSSS